MGASSTYQGLRHLYTAWEVGARGAPGFQTVACSKDLKPHLRALERLVESYRPDVGDNAFRSFQMARLEGAEELTVLTWQSSIGRMPDGRAGNGWAESLVVPNTWMADAAWDLGAVLDATASCWLGPNVRREIRSWPHFLDPVTLPPATPKPLDRLAFLTRSLPRRFLYLLVQTVVRQYRSRAPIAIVGEPETTSENLERTLITSPLLLPPGRRFAASATGSRPLELRTRGPLGSQPGVDLLGVPHGEHLEAGDFRGQVLDLGGQAPMAVPTDGYGLAYAEWLMQILEKEDWPTLESFYADYSTETSSDDLERFIKPIPRLTAAQSSEGDGETDEFLAQALARREQVWKVREQAEMVMDQVSRLTQKDLEQLTETLKHEVETMVKRQDAVVKRQEEEIAKLEQSLSQRSAKLQERLDEMGGKLRMERGQIDSRLAAEKRRLVEDMQRGGDKYREDLADLAKMQHEETQESVKAYHKELRDKARDYRKQLAAEAQEKRDELDQYARRYMELLRGIPMDTVAAGAAMMPRQGPVPGDDGGKPRDRDTPGNGSLTAAATPWWKGSGFRRWSAAFFGLTASVGLIYIVMQLIPHQADPVDDPGSGEETPVELEPAIQKAGEDLREKNRAIAVLKLANERLDLQSWAKTVVLTQLIGTMEAWDEYESCALLQASLDIIIDADCGSGSKLATRQKADSIRAKLQSTADGAAVRGSSSSDLKDHAPLVLQNHLHLPADCTIGWPIQFSGNCTLSALGAQKLIAEAEKVRNARPSDSIPNVLKILEEDLTLGADKTELGLQTNTLLFRIAYRLCTQDADLGAVASSTLPSMELLQSDKKNLQEFLEDFDVCLDKLALASGG